MTSLHNDVLLLSLRCDELRIGLRRWAGRARSLVMLLKLSSRGIYKYIHNGNHNPHAFVNILIILLLQLSLSSLHIYQLYS